MAILEKQFPRGMVSTGDLISLPFRLSPTGTKQEQ